MWFKVLAYQLVEGTAVVFNIWTQGIDGHPVKLTVDIRINTISNMHEFLDTRKVPQIEYDEDIHLVIQYHNEVLTYQKDPSKRNQRKEERLRTFGNYKEHWLKEQQKIRTQQLKKIVNLLPPQH